MKKTAKQLAATQSWRDRNAEKVRADARRRYADHTPEERAAYTAKHRRWIQANREYVNQYKRQAYQINPAPIKSQHLKHSYGITLLAYKLMLTEQHGVCAVCGKPPISQNLHVDHNHSKQKGDAGFIRGLLCSRCNFTLGNVEDSVELLTKLSAYLVKHGR